MGSSDVPPPGAPGWLIPVQTGLLGIGVLFWDATYILMTLRSIKTKSYGMPLLALAINVSWELIFVFYVCEEPIEIFGFLVWLLLDLGLVFTTVKHGPEDWKSTSPWVGRNISWILAGMVAVGCLGQYSFVLWWLAEPNRGTGQKQGKWWGGQEGFDTTELAFWLAAGAQLFASAGSMAMLVVRGHSGGTGYLIWFCRTMGTLIGLIMVNFLLWWYWPTAHAYIINPFGVFLYGSSMACDLIYPFVLRSIRQTEVRLPDGRLARADPEERKAARVHRSGMHEKSL